MGFFDTLSVKTDLMPAISVVTFVFLCVPLATFSFCQEQFWTNIKTGWFLLSLYMYTVKKKKVKTI